MLFENREHAWPWGLLSGKWLSVASGGEEDGMRSLSIPIKISGVVLGVAVVLAIIGLGKVKNTATQTSSTAAIKAPQPGAIPPCNGSYLGSSAGQSASQVNQHPHSVTLSWNAALPASNSPLDAIKGYYVYRSLKSRTYAEGNRISESLLRGTQCVDTAVQPRKTYFYVVKAVTEGGRQSSASVEIRAEVPFP
jgi:hypothetical protein